MGGNTLKVYITIPARHKTTEELKQSIILP